MRFSIFDRDFADRELNPDQMAVIGSNSSFTWRELEKKSLSFEQRLKDLGIQSGQIVTIIGHKQIDYMAAICACIKLGCPYIPIDDVYPKERISKIIEIAQPFCMIDLEKNETKKMSSAVQDGVQIADDLIYIIFTSGSTGDPKGVQIARESVVSMVKWMHEDFNLPENAVFMNQAPFSFDLSVYELMYFLNYGKTIVLNSREVIAGPDFHEKLKSAKVNVWVSTPSFAWSQCINENFNADYLNDLKSFLFCGEILPVKLVKKLNLLFPNAKILNTYGPTEATVATTLIEINAEVLATYDVLPIGYPKKGSKVYIDDIGQICIVGDNVMMGYFNSPDLNAAKMFQSNGQRGFKTGDLGYEKDGLLFCKGRMDDQIKLHGFRIELSEIDQVLTKISHIKEAAVIPIERNGEVIRIAAFLKISGQDYSALEMKEQIKTLLPYYMVPSEYFVLDELPLSANHKVDRKKLKAMYAEKNIKKLE